MRLKTVPKKENGASVFLLFESWAKDYCGNRNKTVEPKDNKSACR